MKIIATTIACALAVTAIPASAAELLTNGDFETGDFTGWVALAQNNSAGDITIETPGADAPLSNFATATNPAGGEFYALTDQLGAGAYTLSQAFTLSDFATSATLSFEAFFTNHTDETIFGPGLDYTSDPNQHARVDILVAGADPFSVSGSDVFANLYIGDDGSGVNPYVSYNFDLLALGLTGGSTYQLRFGQVDNQGFFNMGIDNVSIDVTNANGGAVPEPATWAMMLLGFFAVGAAMRRRTQPALTIAPSV